MINPEKDHDLSKILRTFEFVASVQRWTGIKKPLRHSLQKKSKRPLKFFQKAHFLTFCIRDCEGTCDQSLIATIASLPLPVPFCSSKKKENNNNP
jgi:hypothetical protein